MRPEIPSAARPVTFSRGFLLCRFSDAGQRTWRLFGTVPGRRPKTLYEVSLVKSFCGGQERFLLSYFRTFVLSYFLTFLLSFQKEVLSSKFLHSRRDSPLASAALSGQPPMPGGGTPFGVPGLTVSARAEQQLVIGLMTSEQTLLTFVGRAVLFDCYKSKFGSSI